MSRWRATRPRPNAKIDAGELREELTLIYAAEHVPPWSTSRAQWIVCEIHRLTGIPAEAILADVRADLEVLG